MIFASARRVVMMPIAVLTLLSMSIVNSRICTQSDACTFGVADCADPGMNCSFVFQQMMSFGDQKAAIAACTTKFGPSSTLVTPGDLSVNNVVHSMCPSHRFFDMKRVGTSGANCEMWETLEGTPVLFATWDRLQPDNSMQVCSRRVVENCVGFKYGNANSHWHDARCTPNGVLPEFVARCVVCAVPPAAATTTTITTITPITATSPTMPTTSASAPTASTRSGNGDLTTTGSQPDTSLPILVTPSSTTNMQASTTAEHANTTASAAGGSTDAETTTNGTNVDRTTRVETTDTDIVESTTESASQSMTDVVVSMFATESPEDTRNAAALIGGIVGGVVALLLIVGLILFIVARSRRSKETPHEGNSLQPATANYGRISAPLPAYNDVNDVRHVYEGVSDKLT